MSDLFLFLLCLSLAVAGYAWWRLCTMPKRNAHLTRWRRRIDSEHAEIYAMQKALLQHEAWYPGDATLKFRLDHLNRRIAAYNAEVRAYQKACRDNLRLL